MALPGPNPHDSRRRRLLRCLVALRRETVQQAMRCFAAFPARDSRIFPRWATIAEEYHDAFHAALS